MVFKCDICQWLACWICAINKRLPVQSKMVKVSNRSVCRAYGQYWSICKLWDLPYIWNQLLLNQKIKSTLSDFLRHSANVITIVTSQFCIWHMIQQLHGAFLPSNFFGNYFCWIIWGHLTFPEQLQQFFNLKLELTTAPQMSHLSYQI